MNQTNNSYIINGAEDEMKRTFDSHLNDFDQAVSIQRGYLVTDLNTLKSTINTRRLQTIGNASESDAIDLMFQRSLIFNQTLYDKLFEYLGLSPIESVWICSYQSNKFEIRLFKRTISAQI